MRRSLAFELYFAPTSEAEALKLLASEDLKANPIAGGTDLLVGMKERGLRTECLVALGRIPELRVIAVAENGALTVGATATLREVETSPLVLQGWPALAQAVGTIGSVQVRNTATLGGNLANASPAADSASMLIALQAQLELASVHGTRTIAVEDFFVGPKRSVLVPGEIIRRVIVPPTPEGHKAAYAKFGPREAVDIAIVGVAVALELSHDSTCRSARVAMGAVAPTPMRSPGAEAALLGELSEARLGQAAEAAMKDCRPVDDLRASALYRRHLVGAMLKQAVREATSAASARSPA